MTNRAKQKGTAWESEIVHALKRAGWIHAERRALNGNVDRGDLTGIPGVMVEAKSCKAITPGPWLDEALVERDNAKADVGAVWFKRRGKTTAEDGFVLMDGNTFMRLLKAAGY